MQTIRYVQRNTSQAVFMASLGLIGLHLANAALFHFGDGVASRLLWATAGIAFVSGAAYLSANLPSSSRGFLALAVGLPAFTTGVGIHAVHIFQRGAEASDYTGIAMLLGGAALTILATTILVRHIHDWWRRLLLVPLGVVFALYAVAPVILGIAVTNIARMPICCEDTPDTRGFAYEDVTFETENGLTIGAWYIPTQNGAAIITVHGAGSNRAMVMDEAEILARHGYGVLMLDVEGYGESEGTANAFGWVGARDVAAGIEYLKTRPDVDDAKIGALGLSVGGEILIEASAENPDLQAIVAEGATGRSYDDFDEMDGLGQKLAHPFLWNGAQVMRILTGEPVPPPLMELVLDIAPRDVLLISADIEEERVIMRRFQERGGPSFQMWEIPDSKHVGAFDLHPEEYEQRVIRFFNESLEPAGSAYVR